MRERRGPADAKGTPPPRWRVLSRAAWSTLEADGPPSLSEADLAGVRAPGEVVSPAELAEAYLPLARLIYRRASAGGGAPFVVGVAGSVAAGKSTTARALRLLLGRGPDRRRVELVSTDGFLFPNRVLAERGLLARKGFPESYDLPLLLRFLADVKAGRPEAVAPVYSHQVYDVLPDRHQTVRRPDILILEGLHVLHPGDGTSGRVPDFLDLSVYVDAEEADIQAWYVQRFLALREEARRDEASFFRRFLDLPADQAEALARQVWREVNLVNLREHILPLREHADIILEKGPDHAVRRVRLREP